jgi:hypothetical protein
VELDAEAITIAPFAAYSRGGSGCAGGCDGLQVQVRDPQISCHVMRAEERVVSPPA